MSTSCSEDWLLVPQAKGALADTLTWTTSISRSRVSTVDGLELSENSDWETMNSLESLLRVVQQLKLERIRNYDLQDSQFLAAGETFSVSRCKYQGSLVAIKRIRISEYSKHSGRRHFQRRLQSVLREVLIMCHPPLAHHPNIINLLGYNWTVEDQQPLPFISVEFASRGSLREYMIVCQPMKTKLILMGDIGAGLMALHKCGIVHGDLKMDNVVVCTSLERPSGSIAKISDFGHSILANTAPEKRTQYLGTALYNAPEVSTQRVQPIPEDQLHKCDIWAFGLCVWEILADGQIYFQRAWQKNPLYERLPSYSDSWLMVPLPLTPETHNDAHENDEHRVFGRFDPSHLERLAIQFVNGLNIPGMGFEKGMLRPLLSRTLQTDPRNRISDLSRLPIIGFWNKAPGGHSLQSKLATYTLSGDIQCSIFSRESGPYMIWEQQQQLLQDFEVVAELAQPGKNDGSAAFQSMMCYVNAFGTSGNMTKATKFLSMAEEAGHLVARVMGPRMLDGFTNSSACLQRTYSESLALGFSITRKPQIPPKVFIFRDSSMTEYLDYEVFREKALRGELGNDMNVITGERPNIGSSVRPHALELAIQHGDLELVKALLQDIDNEAALVIEGELLVIQAASRGHGAIVIELLKAGAPIARQNSSSLLHWLFCLDRSNLTEVQLLLQKSSGEFPLETWLNEASTEKITVHPQWPFQIHGTPLATAIAAGNSAAINVLLSLGADPLAQAFAVNEGDESPVLTPIHLAVRYHLPEILQLLWQTAFGEKEISGMKLYQAQALGSSPIACALSLMTNAERFAIHGSAYKEALQNTIQQLSPDILLQSSTEGKNALIQAIDLEDLGTVELLLVHCPMLASRKLQHANSKGMFTYPLHFAVQVGSSRDTEESVQILDRILELDPTAIRRFDSSSVKPLHIAAMGSSARITDFLLNLGASCQDLDWHGKSPLHFSGTAANAKLLLASGADIDHKDNLGFTAAHKAAEKGTEDILQALIDAGANLTSTDSEIGSPLHCAIQRKSRTMAEMLLKAGVDINAQNKTGKTPLLLAMDTGHLDLVIFLFENGAHPFIEDNSGSSPFLMSLAWKNPNILSTFEAHDAFEELSWEAKLKALHFAAKSGEPAPLEQFLRRLPKPPVQIYDCEYPGMVSALHESAASCRVDLLDVLISAGFEVDCRDAIGNTPLNLACQAGRNKSDSQMHARINTCKYLIESGADILSKHNGGLTAFKIARAHCDYPLMTLFLEHALERNGLDEQKRQSRILESIKDPSKEDRFCKEARAFIGYEVFAMKLIQDAVLKEEWEFIMACIGGCFVVKQIFHLRPLSARVDWGMTGWDMLRYYSVLRDRDMVRRVALGSGESESQRTWDVGRRNLEAEYLETKGSIDELLWPGQRKRYSYLDRAILRGPHRDPDASETISNGSKVMHNWSMMKKQKALNFEEIAEHGIEFAEFYVRDYVGTVEFLFEGMQKWRAKRNEIRDHGDNMGDLEWAREILEEVEGTLMYPAEGLPVLMTYCSTQQFTTRGWNSIYQTGKAASESLKVLTKDLKKAFEDVDETMERMRGNQ